MLHAEEMAKERGAERMALDVEKDNETAIAVYRKLGCSIEREYGVKLEGRKYRFYRRMEQLKKKG